MGKCYFEIFSFFFHSFIHFFYIVIFFSQTMIKIFFSEKIIMMRIRKTKLKDITFHFIFSFLVKDCCYYRRRRPQPEVKINMSINSDNNNNN